MAIKKQDLQSVYPALIVVISLLLFVGFEVMTTNSDASSAKSLPGQVYRTPSGSIVEVVEIPSLGKCLLTSHDVICKD